MSSDNPPKPVIDWAAIRHNAFTENPGSDWIALDTNLMPIGRASDLGAVMKGCPGAHAYVQQPAAVETILSSVMTIGQIAAAEMYEDAVEALEVADPPGEEPETESQPAPEPEAPIAGAAAFDHDGDGKVGGSRSRNRSRKPADK